MTMADPARVADQTDLRIAVFAPQGDFDAYSAPSLRAVLARLADETGVVINLAAVRFVDSAGLGLLVGAVRRIREHGGRVALCAPSAPVRRCLEVTGIDHLVSVFDSCTEAVAVVRGNDAEAEGHTATPML